MARSTPRPARPAGTRSPVAVQTSPSPTNARHSARAERDHRSLRANRARGPQGPSRPPAERASCRQRAGARPSGPSPGARAEEHHRARTASRSTEDPCRPHASGSGQAGALAPFGRHPGARASRTPSRRRRPTVRGGEARPTTLPRPWPPAPRPTVAQALHGGPRRRRRPARPGRRSARSLPRHPGHSITSPVPRSRQAEFLSLSGDQDAKRFELSAAGGTLNSARTPASRSSDLDLSVRSRTVDPSPSADTRPETQEVGHGGQRWYSTREARHWGGAPRPWRRSARTGTGDPVAA